jgi:hypothetical protein
MCRQQEHSSSSSSSSDAGKSGLSDTAKHSAAAQFAALLASRLQQLQQQLQLQLQVVRKDVPSQQTGRLVHSLQQALGCIQQLLQHAQKPEQRALCSSSSSSGDSGSLLSIYQGLEAACGPSAAFTALPDAAGAEGNSWATLAVRLLQAVRSAQAAVPTVLQQRPNARLLL